MDSPITRRTFTTLIPFCRLLSQGNPRRPSDSEWSRARGIYIDTRGSSPALGIRFSVLLKTGGTTQEVSTQHKFRSGDRFELHVGLKNDAYLYIVNCTLQGNPEALPRGIEVVPVNNDKPRQDIKYRLLFPLKGMPPAKLEKTKTHVLPVDFVMDENTGLEKLFLLVSGKPVNLSRFFRPDGSMQASVASGRITGPATTGAPSSANASPNSPGSDTNEAVTTNLNRQLREWAENTELGLAEDDARGVEVVSYAVPRKDTQPFVVTVDLLHYPK
jgi:hypothetical protein